MMRTRCRASRRTSSPPRPGWPYPSVLSAIERAAAQPHRATAALIVVVTLLAVGALASMPGRRLSPGPGCRRPARTGRDASMTAGQMTPSSDQALEGTGARDKGAFLGAQPAVEWLRCLSLDQPMGMV